MYIKTPIIIPDISKQSTKQKNNGKSVKPVSFYNNNILIKDNLYYLIY